MKLLGHRDHRMTLRYTAITDETVHREYFEALDRVKQRYTQAQPEAGRRRTCSSRDAARRPYLLGQRASPHRQR
jgi:hypothetical protein